MNIQSEKLKQYIAPGKHVHLVGIGGVSMRPLGLVLKGMGMLVTGSDMNASVSTDELISKGIRVEIGHRAENVQNAQCIIRTAAVHDDNPEIAAARAAATAKRARYACAHQCRRTQNCCSFHFFHNPSFLMHLDIKSQNH